MVYYPRVYRCWCDEEDYRDEPPVIHRHYTVPPPVVKVPIQPKHQPQTPRFPKVGKKAFENQALQSQDALIAVLQATADGRAPGPIFHARLVFPLGKKDLYAVFCSALHSNMEKLATGCSACHDFVTAYGNLCTVDEDGGIVPLFWPKDHTSVPVRYRGAVKAVLEVFPRYCAIGDELTLATNEDRYLGRPRGKHRLWRHLHLVVNGGPLTGSSKDGLDTQTSYTMLNRVLTDYDRKTIVHVQHLLYEKLPYATPHRPVIDFLEGVSNVTESQDPTMKRNLIIKYSRIAWPGCLSSLRGGIVGQLLSDVAAGNEFKDVQARWTAMANPMVYLRPTSGPSAGNISEAEKIFRNLGYSKEDLIRYFMTADQIPESGVLWTNPDIWNVVNPPPILETTAEGPPLPSDEPSEATAVASLVHIISPLPQVDVQAKSISFRAFVRRVLPFARTLEVYLEPASRLAFFTTGAPNSKSPFSFGSVSNTASWYHWSKPLPVEKASLKPGWNHVTSIVSFPHMWEYFSASEGIDYYDESKKTTPLVVPEVQDEDVDSDEDHPVALKKPEWHFSRHGVRYMFCVQDAKEEQKMAASLFPTVMRGEFHCVRKTIEAFSHEEKIREPVGGEGRTHQLGGVSGGSHRWEEVLVRVRTVHVEPTAYRITLFD